jgi:hypothetical protein
MVASILAGIFLFGCEHTAPKPAGDPAELPSPSIATDAPPQTAQPIPDLSHNISAGTVISVKLQLVLDSSATRPGFAHGLIAEDVKGTDGRVAIPAGSTATIFIRTSERKEMISTVVMGLYAVYVGGREFNFSDGRADAATIGLIEDAGRGGRSAIHLEDGSRLDFKLERAVKLQ